MVAQSLAVVKDSVHTTDGIKEQSTIAASRAGSDADYVPEKMPASADEAQEGVREVEAITLSWTKASLTVAFIW